MDDRTRLLRRTLFTNALVTFLFGLLLLVDRDAFAGLLGLAGAFPVAAGGVICIAFAPVLLLASRKRELPLGQASLLVAVDGVWVAASLLVAALAPITPVGRGLVVAQAVLVAAFMVLETAGIRRREPGPV